MKRIAVIARSLPPGGTGEAVLIYRLLAGFDRYSYCLISNEPCDSRDGPDYTPKLPAHYYHLPEEGLRITRCYRFGLLAVRERVNLLLTVLHQARQIGEIIKKEACDAVVVFSGDLTHLPAGFLASRRAHIPFTAYLVDHYLYREFHGSAARFLARWLEPFLMKRTSRVLVLNEAMRDDLRDRFNVEATVLHNSFDLSTYEDLPEPVETREHAVKIVFTGGIYAAHFDAFVNLIEAIKLLGRDDVKLHVYTAQSMDYLTEHGIHGPVVHHQALPMEQMPGVQAEADILFLPLAFKSPYPGVIKTSAPTKMGEYLAARRPVLVHAPADAFVCSYFTRFQCGVVVDEDDPAKLAAGIERILHDPDLSRRLTANGWECARNDFDINSSRAEFAKLLNLER